MHAANVKQFAPACERNKQPILEVLGDMATQPGLVLEVASGTGQHAQYFAARLPHLVWQPTERPGNLASLLAYYDETPLDNLRPPRELDLDSDCLPAEIVDYLVCINTIHIVRWSLVENLFRLGGRALRPGGVMFVYGPFSYADRPLEPSNVEFDAWLRRRDPDSGVREFERVNGLADEQGLRLAEDRAMPANNRSLWWYKSND